MHCVCVCVCNVCMYVLMYLSACARLNVITHALSAPFKKCATGRKKLFFYKINTKDGFPPSPTYSSPTDTHIKHVTPIS